MDLQQNVEQLTGELTLVKGEIKQTLVDLRGFLQRREGLAPDGMVRLPQQELDRMLDEARNQGQSQGKIEFHDDRGPAVPEGSVVLSEEELNRRLEEALRQAPKGSVMLSEEELSRRLEEALRQAPKGSVMLREEELSRKLEEAQAEGRRQAEAVFAQQAASRPPAREEPRAPERPREEPQAAAQAGGPAFEAPPTMAPSLGDIPPVEEAGSAEGPEPSEGQQYAMARAEERRGQSRMVLAGEVRESGSLDTNLVANLFRWVDRVKRKIGSQQLAALIEIYKLSGHLPPTMENVILQMAQIGAPLDAPSTGEATQEALTEALLQLQGIVYGPGYAPAWNLVKWDRPPLRDEENG